MLTLDDYKENNAKQEWVIAKDRIQSKNNSKLILEIRDMYYLFFSLSNSGQHTDSGWLQREQR